MSINKLQCNVSGCDKQASRKYMCQTHYKRLMAGKDLHRPINTHNKLEFSCKVYKKEYAIYLAMKQRCNNPNNTQYYLYGGRGIKVCDRWLESFDNFMNDMGSKPEGMSLDRVDTDGNYDPSNCRWASPTVQSYNQRTLSTNKSGKTGVWQDKNGLYRVYINIHGNRHVLGYTKSFKEAVSIRENGEMKYYGEVKK